MRKTGAVLLIIIGIVLVVISILSLVSAFDTFTKLGTDIYNFGYVFGSVIFPLLLTVFGRWLYRRGKEIFREEKKKNL